MRYYLDEDISPKVAVLGRRRGIDIRSAQEESRWSQTDEAQLLLAAEDDRCLISKNDRDFHRLTLEFERNGLPPYMFDYLHPAPGS